MNEPPTATAIVTVVLANIPEVRDNIIYNYVYVCMYICQYVYNVCMCV